jgi:hypothetical protein
VRRARVDVGEDDEPETVEDSGLAGEAQDSLAHDYPVGLEDEGPSRQSAAEQGQGGEDAEE